MVIKQILDAPENGFKLYGMSFGIVTIVGIVRSLDHSSTKITITMEDHTGQIDAHLWLEDGDMANTPNLLLNTYARIHGSIRNQNGTKVLMIIKIQTLPSINELTTHLLEVLNARYSSENYSKNGNEAISSVGAVHSTVNSYSNNASSFADNSSAAGHNGLKGKHLMIFNAVREHSSEQGISLQELQAKFKQISSNELGYVWPHPNRFETRFNYFVAKYLL